MKNKYKGYYKYSKKKITNIWDNCIFVFDTNSLLNLYRYSSETRDAFLELLVKIKDRVWLPYHVGKEFHKRRLGVIDTESKKYDTTKSNLDEIKKTFTISRSHPFISSSLLEELNTLFLRVKREFDKNKREYIKLKKDDVILKKLDLLFKNKVGDRYSEEKLDNIYKEAQKRFHKNIPPGYMDYKSKQKNPNDDSFNVANEFGDYIIWKQILEYSLKMKKNIIFITNDEKDDWWLKLNGERIGVRPELIEEIYEHSNVNFIIYTPDSFMQLSNTYLKQKIKEKTIKEVKEVSKQRPAIDEKSVPDYLSALDKLYASPVTDFKIPQLYQSALDKITNSTTLSLFNNPYQSALDKMRNSIIDPNSYAYNKSLSDTIDWIRNAGIIVPKNPFEELMKEYMNKDKDKDKDITKDSNEEADKKNSDIK